MTENAPRLFTRVDPELIKEQREQGWPDMHPEDFCHLCGGRNELWATGDRESWLEATKEWAAETGREGIVCIACFTSMHEQATGRRTIWVITPFRTADATA